MWAGQIIFLPLLVFTKDVYVAATDQTELSRFVLGRQECYQTVLKIAVPCCLIFENMGFLVR